MERWKPRIAEIASMSLNPLAARADVLMHIGLWPTAIRLNPSGRAEVSKSDWIKPWGDYLKAKMFQDKNICTAYFV